MTARALPPAERTTILFAHVAYQLASRFEARAPLARWIEVRSLDELKARIPEADVLLCSGLWRNELIPLAPRLAFVQSVSAGTDQYDRQAFARAGIRLASAQGANEGAVAEHALALMLAMTRQLPQARDHQRSHFWRGMIGEIARREEELGGKHLLIVGMGRIGARLARLAKAFDMRVTAIRRDLSAGPGPADALYGLGELDHCLAQADFVALTCPLTPETESLINAARLARMKPTAYLINVARGRVVQEPDLIAALKSSAIAGAALDCVWEEPLPAQSPLWDLPGVFITPHTAGETRRYEDNVLDLLVENLERLWRGESNLRNQIC